MLRKIIKIDKDKCVGCGLCVAACQEGAIGIVEGKAELLRDDYCDGLGNCLPVCPTNAISFEEREGLEYNKDETKKKLHHSPLETLPCGCPGTNAKTIKRTAKKPAQESVLNQAGISPESNLNQWPVQIKLVPLKAPYFENAKLLVSADCAAYAYGNFHQEFMKDKITLIGCPKLDDGEYSEKLTAILKENNIKSVAVTRMEVPCCGGLENAVKEALKGCGKMIPWQVVTISTDGQIVDMT